MFLLKSHKIQRAIKREIVEPVGQFPSQPTFVILPPPDKWIAAYLSAWLAIVASGEHGDVQQVTICGFGSIVHAVCGVALPVPLRRIGKQVISHTASATTEFCDELGDGFNALIQSQIRERRADKHTRRLQRAASTTAAAGTAKTRADERASTPRG